MSYIRKYNILQEEVGKYFGYKNGDSFKNSKKKSVILKGAERLIERIEQEIINKIENQ